jgi:hypothetical protein
MKHFWQRILFGLAGLTPQRLQAGGDITCTITKPSSMTVYMRLCPILLVESSQALSPIDKTIRDRSLNDRDGVRPAPVGYWFCDAVAFCLMAAFCRTPSQAGERSWRWASTKGHRR